MSQNVVLLDRDGVINHDSDDYILSPDAWQPVSGSLEAIADLTQAGLALFVITNQSALHRGYIDSSVLAAIHARMLRMVAEHGGRLVDIFFCPHRPDESCSCRKPRQGMITQLAAKYPHHDLAQAFFVGDTMKDIQLAKAIQAQPLLVRTGKGRKTETLCAEALTNVPIFANLRQAADQYILPRVAACC